MSMESKKLNFVEDGITKLPPGFRFQPTEEEIVYQYLMRKIFSMPLPASVVPEITSFFSKYEPWDLPGGDGEQDRYFFTKKEAKYQSGNRSNRATSSGYWKATGSDKRITAATTCRRPRNPTGKVDMDCSTTMEGMRKTLVFHTGKPSYGSRTHWIIHEYRLIVPSQTTATHSNSQHNISSQSSLVQMGDWVLCRLFLKKRNTETEDDEINNNLHPLKPRAHLQPYDSDSAKPGSSSPTSSCGSSFFNSSALLDDEETSGRNGCNSNNFLSPHSYPT